MKNYLASNAANSKKRVLLMGNANVGKSTVFNEITGSHQHTGNWTGKTVDMAEGCYYYKHNDYELIDLPGTYSLLSVSEEERIAKNYLCFESYDCVICVIDATAIERNLKLLLQILEVTDRVVVLLNLCDEAKKKSICVDLKRLSDCLGIPVVKATARSGRGINDLLETVHMICNDELPGSGLEISYGEGIEPACKALESTIKDAVKNKKLRRFFALRCLEGDRDTLDYLRSICPNTEKGLERAMNILSNFGYNEQSVQAQIVSIIHGKAHSVAQSAVSFERGDKRSPLDKILLGKVTSIPVMLLIIGAVLWLTVVGSNYPSALLQDAFMSLENMLAEWLLSLGADARAVSLLVFGILRVLLWVVAVMLPPMAIFFPLFSLLENFGFLPRLAFNLDGVFERCGACGKQALTTCMGYGCNAVGVTGCRIIDSPRERLVAIITNSLTPCNGRFPLLIAVISMFFTDNSVLAVLILLSMLCLSMLMTFLSSGILSKTVLKGEASSFVLELPPFRKPKLSAVLGETLRDKVIPVLLRAVTVASPVGAVIWLLSNISIGDTTLLCTVANVLDPLGRFIGLDGVMLLAFILGFPANEIVIPIALMTYLSSDTMSDYTSLMSLRDILTENGWTIKTALCTCVFSMFHFPCSTTLLTIYKETKSVKWTALSVLTPLILGTALCALINLIF